MATVLAAVVIGITAIWIMYNRMGLNDAYDFGAGAYFYADTPQLQDVASSGSYHTSVPTWLHILLFLAWGWLMYRFWCWIDKK